MRMKLLVFTALVIFVLGTSAFNYRGSCPDYGPRDTIRFFIPANFPKPVYDFKNNRLTRNGFELGRSLFYDPLLSRDGTISCANCHQSFAAFAQLDHPVSHGVDECLGTRNALPLFNLAWQKEYMWDGGVTHMENSPLNALTNTCEMANELKDVVRRLNAAPGYQARFREVYGHSTIDTQQLLRALAQFTSMLISANSRYDQVMRKEKGAAFNADEAAGYRLFIKNCSSCHREPLFTDGSYRSNGLDQISDDVGRDSVTHLAADRGKFRVPSLRNVEVSGPYMHDGRFSDLNQVVDHYASGVKNSGVLDPLLRQNAFPGIRLAVIERKQLIAFLKTLTDKEFIHNPNFQDPKKQ